MEPFLARRLWQRLEALNAVSYFSPECRAAPEDLGLRGFWMGYFACRAAPMGPVAAGVVEATFANFHPERVRRAIPDAWDITAPADLVVARSDAAAAALRRLLGGEEAERIAELAAPVLADVVDVADPAGRPLFAANREVDAPPDPVARLWQLATTLREHRGDGHVALLTAAGLDGCGSHVLFAADAGVTADLYQRSRGWSADDWRGAVDRLTSRGLLGAGGLVTSAGRAEREEIEQRTDELAAVPFGALTPAQVDALLEVLGPAAERVAASGEILFPNPMGLPKPGSPQV